jgi:hypothetical protein
MTEKRSNACMTGAFKFIGSSPDSLGIHKNKSPIRIEALGGRVPGNSVRVNVVENLFHCVMTGEWV